MKPVLTTFLGTAAALALAAGMVFAQAGAAEPMRHGRGGFMGEPGLGFALRQLNLSADQKTQVKQLWQTAKPNLQPLMRQEFQVRQQMIQLVTSGNFDAAKAATIASQESQAHLQLEVEHAKIASEIYQLLNSDQKAKVADMMAKHHERMQQHLEDQQNPPTNQ